MSRTGTSSIFAQVHAKQCNVTLRHHSTPKYTASISSRFGFCVGAYVLSPSTSGGRSLYSPPSFGPSREQYVVVAHVCRLVRYASIAAMSGMLHVCAPSTYDFDLPTLVAPNSLPWYVFCGLCNVLRSMLTQGH